MKFVLVLAVLSLIKSDVSAAGCTGWNYDDQSAWKDLDCDGNECGDAPTAMQGNSPININEGQCKNEPNIELKNVGNCTFADLTYHVKDNNVIASYPANGECVPPSMIIPEKADMTFTAAQFHVHTACEHTINEKGCDAELHVVHLNEDGNEAAVLGFMIDNGATSPDQNFASLLECWAVESQKYQDKCNVDMCHEEGHDKDRARRNLAAHLTADIVASCSETAFSPYNMVPDGAGYYYYMGGLTTPPCTQFVNWNLVDRKVSITLKEWTQLANLILNYAGYIDGNGECVSGENIASKFGSTSRVTQPVGERTIVHKCGVFASGN